MSQEDKNCCLCDGIFSLVNPPRMMPFCEHNGCTHCLKAKILPQQPLTIFCLVCKISQVVQDADLESFPKNISLIKLLKESSKSEKPILKQAEIREQKVDNSGSTMGSRIQNLGLSNVDSVCPIHKKQLEIICITDREHICAHCAIFGAHKDHKLKTLQEVMSQIAAKEASFRHSRAQKQTLDAKISSPAFREGIVSKIGEQKDRLVAQIKAKFAKLYQNVRLAEKKAFDDVIKGFKTLYQRITALIRQENDAQKKYRVWQKHCLDLFRQVQRCKKWQQKVGFYFGGPLELCGEGETHVRRVAAKIDNNISTIEGLMGRIKVVQNLSASNAVFNFIHVFMEEQSLEALGHVPQEPLSTTISVQQSASRKPIKVEFSTPDPLQLRTTPQRPNRSSSKEQERRIGQKRSPVKSKNQEGREGVQRIVNQFCQRQGLDTLDLSGFALSDGQIIDVLRFVKGKRVRGLKLVKNKVSNEGLLKILELLPVVTNLNLSFNQLTQEALQGLISCREKLPTLRIINLSNNRINERKAKAAIDQLKRSGIIVTI